MTKFNNSRTHEPPQFGAPEFTQDLAQFDNGNEVVFLEEKPSRYQNVPASSYDLEKQLAQGVKPEKTAVYMHMEQMYGAEIATRTVQELQNRIDTVRVEQELRQLRANSEQALLTAARAAAKAASPTPASE